MVGCHQVMYREDIGHLDVQSRLRPSVEVVKLVDVKLFLGI